MEEADMKRKASSKKLFILLAIILGATRAETSTIPSVMFEVEGGAVWQSRNNVQIPNDNTGTRFSLDDVIGNGPWPAVRFYATWNINEKHGLRILVAPLSITETAELDRTLDFAGASFIPSIPTTATYKFNSWRLSYRYRFYIGKQWRLWIGFSAKIRDAKISLDQGTEVAEKTDIGFVPLLHIAASWHINTNWSAELDIDALAGGPGRAEDASLKLKYKLNDYWSLAAGYRTVEGGADVDEVYNFAWLHYAVVSIIFAY
jgi:hypothetical protein